MTPIVCIGVTIRSNDKIAVCIFMRDPATFMVRAHMFLYIIYCILFVFCIVEDFTCHDDKIWTRDRIHINL
jgi:hypothetical protein